MAGKIALDYPITGRQFAEGFEDGRPVITRSEEQRLKQLGMKLGEPEVAEVRDSQGNLMRANPVPLDEQIMRAVNRGSRVFSPVVVG